MKTEKKVEPHESDASEIFSQRRNAAKARKLFSMYDTSALESVRESNKDEPTPSLKSQTLQFKNTHETNSAASR